MLDGKKNIFTMAKLEALELRGTMVGVEEEYMQTFHYWAMEEAKRRETHKPMRKKAFSAPAPASPAGGLEECGCAGECAAGVCVLCVCCPLALFWCCIEAPCKLGWRAARRLAGRLRRRRPEYDVMEASSSCSDVELDVIMPCKGRRMGQR